VIHLPNILAAANPVAHVIDHSIAGDYIISNVTILLILASIVTAAIIIPAARKIATTRNGHSIDDMRAMGAHANFVEAVCLYLRDEIFRPILHDETDKYIGVLWTFFWFILVCNLLGLFPLIDLTATQSIWVTGALAFIAFLIINVAGLTKDPIGYVKHLTGGAPWYVWPFIVPVELIGIFVKPFALAIRLFANMSGGHILLAVLFSFVGTLFQAMGPAGLGVGLLPLLGGVAIFMLEILVAFIQAFIFAFLTGLFIGQLVVHHDDHSHDDEHGHPPQRPHKTAAGTH